MAAGRMLIDELDVKDCWGDRVVVGEVTLAVELVKTKKKEEFNKG